MISRKTIIWFLLLLMFTAALEFHWRAIEQKSLFKPVAVQEILGNSFDLCHDMWERMPIWVELCTLGWLVSLINFVANVFRDIRRWLLRRSQHKREAPQP